MLLMLGASVMPRGTYGGVEPGFTLEHYRRFLDPLYLQVLWRTIAWAALATVICLLLGFPVAWVIAASRPACSCCSSSWCCHSGPVFWCAPSR